MIKLKRVKIRVLKREAKGRHMFVAMPRVFLTQLANDISEINIDFLEQWKDDMRGSGSDRFGKYEIVCFSNLPEGADFDTTPHDWFEMKLYFNKPVDIIGKNGKKHWTGIVVSETCYKKGKMKKSVVLRSSEKRFDIN